MTGLIWQGRAWPPIPPPAWGMQPVIELPKWALLLMYNQMDQANELSDDDYIFLGQPRKLARG